MPYVAIRHRVSNYEVWRAYFDGDSRRQRDAGVLSRRVYRTLQDKRDVRILFEIESRDRFLEMMDDPELKALMAKAGVVSEPELSFWDDCGGMDLRGLPRERKKKTSRASGSSRSRGSRKAAPARKPKAKKAAAKKVAKKVVAKKVAKKVAAKKKAKKATGNSAKRPARQKVPKARPAAKTSKASGKSNRKK